ncbi:hypothetical protein ANCCAN_00358 [Ancylostoma caninum]|uniref:Uncharacterized protein n=1 Tax=Ancylostoma caninum TaxID=29170 RepID=A0A368H9S5_ANCCA|nr:hypothetical protein ANCCAN_00358 [Ancylostoma caninum]
MSVEPEPHAFVWSRHHSHRSSNRHYEYLLGEADTLCLLPSSMRVLCTILCTLLICSLAAAIFNSLQGNSHGSASYCKRPEESFTPQVLCPRETMFFYYMCCTPIVDGNVVCCAQVRVWLLIAIVCVTLSCVIGLSYTIFRYCCVCDKEDDIIPTSL